jgi:tryptophanyl-tRNA synthetase
VLMAADILMFKAHKVPVGRDQIQHIEMARDMAASFNHLYGEHFVLPEAAIDEHVATLPGLDGRKMSKSYDNTIPLFSSREQLKKLIGSIVTDSRTPGEPKDVDGSALFQIYEAFATPSETEALRTAFADGIAWGDAKNILLERVDQVIAPMRAQYEELIHTPARIEEILLAGADRARSLATPFIRELRAAVGLRSLANSGTPAEPVKAAKVALPSFKQYRETDGKFYFKLVAADGRLLLQSVAFNAPKDAGLAIARLQREGLSALYGQTTPVDGILDADIDIALAALASSKDV